MNEVIKVNYETEQPTVSARELHEKLEIKTKFSTWFERMCEYGFSSGKEFFPKLGETSQIGGRPPLDYDLTIRCAKEICMIQRTDIGKEIRNYFLDLEDAWNSPEQVMARALKMADKTIDKLKKENSMLLEDNERMKPKEEFFDAVAGSKDAIEIGKVAKVLNYKGIGRNKLFEILRDRGILMKDNIPYQKYIDNGCFRTIEQKFHTPNGEIRINIKTLVYQKGVDYIRKILEVA